MATYVLVAIASKKLKFPLLLHAMLQILNVTLFEKASLIQWHTDMVAADEDPGSDNKLILR